MASPQQTLGPFFDDDGAITPDGAIHFLDPDTVQTREVYADEDLTVPADNPIILGSDGKMPYQVFYGEGQYLVRQYKLIDSSIVSPVFPTDYSLIREWLDNEEGNAGGLPQIPDSFTVVETIQQLTENVDPSVYNVAEVIGYYDVEDQIDSRQYYWDENSVLSPDGGSVLSSSLVGTGRWILKTQSDIIDVRWFGAIAESGIDANAGLTAAAAFGVSSRESSKEVFIPSGTYQWSAGTIPVSTGLKMADRVFFFIPNNGDLIIQVNNRFDFRMQSDVLVPSSQGQVIFDFTTNSTAKKYFDLIKPIWYKNQDNCFQFSGNNPILIDQEYTIDLSSSVNANLVFRDSGKLNLEGTSKMQVTSITSDNNTRELFAYTYEGSELLGFDAGIELYSAWMPVNDVFKFADKTGCLVNLNNNRTLPASYILDLSMLSALNAQGGKFIINSAGSFTAPDVLNGKLFQLEASNITMTMPNALFNSKNFFLTSALNVESFIEVANIESKAVFNGEKISENIQLESSCFVENVLFEGDLTLEAFDFRFVDTTITGNLNWSNSISVSMHNSTVFPANTIEWIVPNFEASETAILSASVDLECQSVTLDNCTINANVQANVMEIKNSEIFSTLVPTVATQFDFDIRNNIFRGGYIKPNGTALSNKSYIIENDFQFPSGEDPNTFLYDPIDDSDWTVTGEDVSMDGQTVKTAYNILVKDNTPALSAYLSVPLPTNGTLVRQTYVRGYGDLLASIQIDRRTGKSNTLILSPYISNEGNNEEFMFFSELLVTPRTEIGAGVVTKAAPRQFLQELLPDEPYFSVDWEQEDNAQLTGSSFIFNLYPQRAL